MTQDQPKHYRNDPWSKTTDCGLNPIGSWITTNLESVTCIYCLDYIIKTAEKARRVLLA